MTTPFPARLAVELDSATREDGDLVLGGAPLRAMRLSAKGRAAYDELLAGPPLSAAARVLARRLTDAGIVHPRPESVAAPDVTVVIPARDRAAELDRCLASLDARYRVVVVDDGSADADAIAKVVAEHGADLVRREAPQGPAAARNLALASVETALVAFLDSDCMAAPDWIDDLAGHFDDPLVAAVAPRIVPIASDTAARRYALAAGALDLGPRQARVVPLTPVAYVPTAALVMRRDVVASISFDEALRYGEDVDLIWRLHDAGWRIRYDPSVEVRHDEPATWGELLARRHRYGTSAAPLAIRHPQYISPAVLSLRLSRRAIAADTMAVTRYLSQFVAPLAILGAAPALRQWRIRRPPLHPAGFVAARLADDLAYGAGVWRGAIRHRTLIPLLPTLHRMKERANG